MGFGMRHLPVYVQNDIKFCSLGGDPGQIFMEGRRTVRVAGRLNDVNEYSYKENQHIGEFLVSHKKENYFIVSDFGVLEDDETCSMFNNADGLYFKMRCLYYKKFPDKDEECMEPFSLEQRSLRSIIKFLKFVAYHKKRLVDNSRSMTSMELFSFDERNPLIIFKLPCSFHSVADVGSCSFEVRTIIKDKKLVEDVEYLRESICDALAKSLHCNSDGLRNFLNGNPPDVSNLIELSKYSFELKFPYVVTLPVVTSDKIIEITITIEDDDFKDDSLMLIVERVSIKFEDALKTRFSDNVDIRQIKKYFPADFFMLLSHSFELSQIPHILTTPVDPNLKTAEFTSEKERYLEIGSKYNIAKRHPCITEFDDLCQSLQDVAANYLVNITTRGRERDLFKISTSLPYISIVGPAEFGKTQFSYILQAIFPNCFVRLLANDEESVNAQPINNENSKLSAMFMGLCEDDALLLKKIVKKANLKILTQSCKMFSHKLIREQPLKSIGFVVALLAIVAKSKYAVDYLEYASEEDIPNLEDLIEFRYREMSYMEAIFQLSHFGKRVPCVFLDEFNLGTNTDLLVYMRNILRALGVVCVTLGTDSRASNLVDPSFLGRPSSTAGKGDVWVYVWTRLPKMTFNTLTKSETLLQLKVTLQNKPEWVKFFAWFQTIPSQNCRMMTFAAEQVLKYFLLDDCLTKPFHEFLFYLIYNVQLELSKIKRLNNGKSKLYARIGTIVSNFIIWREDFRETKEKAVSSDLIHSHYALLDFPLGSSNKKCFFALERDCDDEDMILVNEGASDKWEPFSVYPGVKNNELYYLIIGAAQARNGMQYFSNRTSISVFWQYLQKIYRHNASQSNPHNAFRRAGADFDNLGLFAFMTASRMGEGSFAGTDLRNFLKHLVMQFDFDENRRIVIKNNPHFAKISGRIPYLAPMDSSFSKAFIALEGIFVRFLESTKDSEQIDGRISRRLADEMLCAIEFKHWSRAVSKSQVASIILKAYENEFKGNVEPKISNVLFIFARKFTKTHAKTKYEKLKTLQEHCNIVFLKLSASSASKSNAKEKSIQEISVSQRVLKSSSPNPDSKPTIYVIQFSLTAIFDLKKYTLKNDSGSLIKDLPEQEQPLAVPSAVPLKRRAQRRSI